MRRRERELVEVVFDGLDLAVVANLVAEAEERVLHGAADLRDRVQAAERELLAGEREVEHLLAQAPVELLVGERALAGLDRRLEPLPDPVEEHPLSRSRTPRSACATAPSGRGNARGRPQLVRRRGSRNRARSVRLVRLPIAASLPISLKLSSQSRANELKPRLAKRRTRRRRRRPRLSRGRINKLEGACAVTVPAA